MTTKYFQCPTCQKYFSCYENGYKRTPSIYCLKPENEHVETNLNCWNCIDNLKKNTCTNIGRCQICLNDGVKITFDGLCWICYGIEYDICPRCTRTQKKLFYMNSNNEIIKCVACRDCLITAQDGKLLTFKNCQLCKGGKITTFHPLCSKCFGCKNQLKHRIDDRKEIEQDQFIDDE